MFDRPGFAIAALGAISVVLTGLLFLLARSEAWSLGWTSVGLLGVNGFLSILYVAAWNPVLVERRMWPGQGTKAWDYVWLAAFVAIVVALGYVAIEGPEAGVSVAAASEPTWAAGALLHICGWLLVTWAMIVNPFFEKTVRIQADNDHRVIDSGPYRWVRHPGYVGFTAIILSLPLLLASMPTLTPGLLAALAFIVRTAMEDRMLIAELEGYEDYSRRVRYRLVPGVW